MARIRHAWERIAYLLFLSEDVRIIKACYLGESKDCVCVTSLFLVAYIPVLFSFWFAHIIWSSLVLSLSLLVQWWVEYSRWQTCRRGSHVQRLKSSSTSCRCAVPRSSGWRSPKEAEQEQGAAAPVLVLGLQGQEQQQAPELAWELGERRATETTQLTSTQ